MGSGGGRSSAHLSGISLGLADDGLCDGIGSWAVAVVVDVVVSTTVF